MTPQCTKRWQLYDHMSRVLKMCEEAGFERPWECVKYDGIACVENSEVLDFSYDPKLYEFFLHFLEGRPVFRDSEMYRADNGWRCRWSDSGKDWQDEVGNWFDQSEFALTWNPPQRTIEINGVKVKAPKAINIYGDVVSEAFDTQADAEAFKAALEGKKNG